MAANPLSTMLQVLRLRKLEIRNSLLNVVLYDKPEIRKHDASEDPR